MAQQGEKKQSAATGIGVGGSSILAVFVILCLTTFATLSLVSAQADLRLTQRSADNVSLYYQADAQAQQLLAELGSHALAAPSFEQFTEKAAAFAYVKAVAVDPTFPSATVHFAIPMDETRQLSGSVLVSGMGDISVHSYQVTDADAPEGGNVTLEDSLPVWDGQVPA